MEFKGLNKKEVNERKEKGLVNKAKTKIYKSYFEIIKDSFFSFFNLILYGVALCFLLYQVLVPTGLIEVPITKYGFFIVIFINGIICLFTEIRSKKTIEKLEIPNSKKVFAFRDDKEVCLDSEEIVINDILLIKNGDILPVDGRILKGMGQFNESILTGESSLVLKKEEDEVLAGSTFYGDDLIIKTTRVGNSIFIKEIENKTKSIKKEKSQLNKDIYKIIKYMSILMVPATLIVFLKEFYLGDGINHRIFNGNVLVKSATIVIGMIPIGLVFLSSLILANSIYKLSKEQILCKELYGIENLSRINALALDKTGTITESKITLVDYSLLKEIDDFNDLFSFYLSSFDDNETSLALKTKFNKLSNKDYEISDKLLFESKNKYTSLKINEDTYSLGAFEVLVKDETLKNELNKHAKMGKRILAFNKNDETIAYFILENKLRDNIKETISYFSSINVDIYVISGDNPLTVEAIAKQAGININEEVVDLTNKTDSEIKKLALTHNIYARANPHQKELIISTLENNRVRVGYIGDGVNDITSLRRATCSISFKSAVESARQISDFVLLDDNFIHLKDVIEEGRKVVNKAKRSCSLFLSKDILIFFFAIFSLFSYKGLFIEIESIYIYEFIILALGGFLLSFENYNPIKIEDNFMKEAVIKGVISGLLLSIPGLLLIFINNFYHIEHLEELTSLMISLSGPIIFFYIIKPMTKFRTGVLIICTICTLLLIIGLPNVFLDPSYLKSANNLTEQILLLKNALFNVSFFKEINFYEYLIMGIYLVCLIIFFIIYEEVKKKILKKEKYQVSNE